jgi:hypothetical protein
MGPRAHCSRRCMGGPQVTSGVAVQTPGRLKTGATERNHS